MKLKVTFFLARAPTAAKMSAPAPVLSWLWPQGFPLLISAVLLKPCLLFLYGMSRYFVAGGFSDSPP